MVLEPGWLAEVLATIDAEVAAWPVGIRESFESRMTRRDLAPDLADREIACPREVPPPAPVNPHPTASLNASLTRP